jgi:hypothetical protein
LTQRRAREKGAGKRFRMTRIGALLLVLGYLVGWGADLGFHGPVSCPNVASCLPR